MTAPDTTILAPKPGQTLPALHLPLIGGGVADITKPTGEHDWRLIVIYRGKHCPLCTQYLVELEATRAQLSDIGIDVIAVSADSEERATAHLANIETHFPVAYDLSEAQMQKLGLYISGPQSGVDVARPFAEPGLFTVDDQARIQLVDISNLPFSRPSLAKVANGMAWLRSQTAAFPINGSHA
ncbi:MAG: redoxin domain-containing protein [Pseudomonadota bacterium]